MYSIPYNEFIHPQPYKLPVEQIEYKGRIILYDKNNPPSKDYLENLTGEGPFYYYSEEKTNE